MKNVLKSVVLCLIILPLHCCGDDHGKREEDKINRQKEYEKKVEFYAGKYSSLISLEQIRAEVDQLISDRKEDAGEVINEVRSEYLVNEIVKYGESHPVDSSRLLLLLYQYSGAADSEGLSEILTEWFYREPVHVITALTGIENELMAEFRNEDFLYLLYSSSCNYPFSVTESSEGLDYENENREMRIKLLALKAADNEKIIQYLLENVFVSE